MPRFPTTTPRNVSITYTWEPDPVELAAGVFRVADALRNPQMPLLFAGEEVLEDIRQRFLTETAPDGTPWAEWADSYEPYATSYPNEGILRQTGELYDAATSEDTIMVRQDTLFYDSSGLPERGAWHQEGRPSRKTASGTPNPLPKRPFLGVSGEAQALIFATFAEWFDRALDLYVTTTGRIGRAHTIRSGTTGRFIPRSSPMPPRIG